MGLTRPSARRRTDPTTPVALLGAGRMAREHARALAAVPGVSLAGVFSRTRARAEALAAEFSVPHVCDSVADLFEKTAAVLAVVAVSVESTEAVARECGRHAWTVMLEKPPGLTPGEARRIRSQSGSDSGRIRVALNRRFLSSARTVHAALAADGPPRFIRVQDQQDLDQAAAAGHPERVRAHWMYANSIHLVDFFRFFGRGPVTRVDPIRAWDPERPGPVVSHLRFGTDDWGLYEAQWNAPGPWAVTVASGPHRWELRPLESGVHENIRTPPAALAADSWDQEFKPGFRAQAEAAVDAALGRPSRLPTLDEAIETMDLIARIYPKPAEVARSVSQAALHGLA